MQFTFSSQGRNIGIDVVLPAEGGRRPAVLLLHGSGGISDFPDRARELVMHGYVLLAPHYFESTGTSWADLDSIQRHGVTWGKTILDAVRFARELPHVDPEAIGVLGFSLGAYLGIAVAVHDRRIKCVAEFFGGMPEKFLPSIDHLPPTFIVHGEDDHIVPVRHALRLKHLCEQKKFCYEIEIYPGAGHNFSETLMRTAMGRVTSFLDRQLKTQHSMRILGTAS